MTELDSEFQGELPVGIAEVFLWASWRTWAIFFGTAASIGGLGAALALVIGILESQSDGVLAESIKVVCAAVIGFSIVRYATRWMVELLWSSDILNDEIVGKANVSVGFRNRDDYILALLWLCCMPTILVLAGRFIAGIAEIDMAILEDGMTLAALVVLGAWERVLSRILERSARA